MLLFEREAVDEFNDDGDSYTGIASVVSVVAVVSVDNPHFLRRCCSCLSFSSLTGILLATFAYGE